MNKSYAKSKTLWVSLILLIAPFFPEVQHIMKDNPEAAGAVVAGVFSFLRLITKKPLVYEEDKRMIVQDDE